MRIQIQNCKQTDPIPKIGLRLPAMALAALMISSGTLPVLAAGHTPNTGITALGRQINATPHQTEPLIASENDEKKKKKKEDKKSYDKGYQEGREDGKNKGYKKGEKSGYEEGYEEGKDKGKIKGYEKGYDDGKEKGKDKGYDKGYEAGRDDHKSHKKSWGKPVVVNNNFYAYPGWARSRGWYVSRPWGGGWYGGWSSPPWGWWVGQSVVWGVTTLTTAAILNNAIDRAIERRQTVIVVPNTSWQLYYGTVKPIAQNGVIFAAYNGNGTFEMEADCKAGLLNGEVPSSASEAQLINAACQVTFGRGI